MNTIRRLFPFSRMLAGAAGVLALWAVCAWTADEPVAKDPATASSTGPQYDEKGQLKFPADFRTWVFVGSNMGIEYRDETTKYVPAEGEAPKPIKPGNFHNIYINPEAYREYSKSGKFPEKTMLVLDSYKAESGEPLHVVSEGRFPGKQTNIALAVKDSARPDGGKSVWAYYDFKLDQTGGAFDKPVGTAKAFPDKACHDCHVKHASVDNVWVQFYPTLLKARPAK